LNADVIAHLMDAIVCGDLISTSWFACSARSETSTASCT